MMSFGNPTCVVHPSKVRSGDVNLYCHEDIRCDSFVNKPRDDSLRRFGQRLLQFVMLDNNNRIKTTSVS